MIKPRHCFLDGPDGRHLGHSRATQQDDGKPQRACCCDLAVGRSPTAVLGNNNVDAVSGHQLTVSGLSEWTPADDIGCMWDRQRRIDRLDAAHEIVVLWRPREGFDPSLAKGEKNMARLFAERLYGPLGVGGLNPTVARKRRPWRAPQREQGDVCGRGNGGGIRRDNCRVRMRGVDEDIDALPCEIVSKALGAAESADSHRCGLRRRRHGAAPPRDPDAPIRAFPQALPPTPPPSRPPPTY